MPSKSKAQQKFMGMVHALQKGELDPKDVSQDVRDAAASMKKKDAKDFASTSHKGLPRKVKQEIINRLKEYANKMGTDHLGGDDYTSSKKGGLRDNDGYDNVDYNKDMPMSESADYKYLTQTILDAKPKHNVYYNSGHNKVNIGGVGYDGGDLVKNFNQKPGSSSKIKNNFYYADQDPQKTKREVEKLSKGKIKVDIQKGYGGKPMAVYIVKESVEEGKLPNNWMQGRTSDYHTKLRGKKREYDDTNFEKDNSGQPDLEEAGLKGIENIPSNKKLSKLSDNEKLNILQSSGNIISFHIPDWAKGRYKMWQVISAGKIKKKKDLDGEIIYFLPGKGPQKSSPTYPSLKDLLNGVDWETMEMRRESVNESFDKVEHLKLLNLALRTMPGSQKQKEIIRKLNKVRVAGGMRPLKEDLSDVIYQVKKFEKPKDEKLLTIKVINKLKDMRNKSKSSSNKQKLQKMIDKIEGDYKKGKFLTEAPIFHTMNNPRFKKATKDLVKNKKVKNPDTGQDVQLTTALKDKEHPAHKQAKSLFQRLFGEYASNQTLSFLPLDDEEIKKMNEGTMVRRAVDIAQELLPKDTWSRYASDGKKNAEFVKNVVRDLARSLNQFYKNYNINVRIHK